MRLISISRSIKAADLLIVALELFPLLALLLWLLRPVWLSLKGDYEYKLKQTVDIMRKNIDKRCSNE